MSSQKNTQEDFAIGLMPEIPWRVIQVKALPEFCLKVKFSDGISGSVDMCDFIHAPDAGVFSILKDNKLFTKVYLDYGAVTWPGELDLAPDAMYEMIKSHGSWKL